MLGRTIALGMTCLTWVTVLVLGAAPAMAGTFDDVPPWAQASVDAITSAGVMEGCGGVYFCPYRPVTREDMAVWLERASRGAGWTPGPGIGYFEDVPATYYLAGWIEQLYTDGITKGCRASPPLYCPFYPVSRAQMAVFLLRLEHGPDYRPSDLCPEGGSGSFVDVPCSYWGADWIEELYREGITAGCATDPARFCPDDEVNRVQMAVFITAACRREGAQCAGSW